MAIGVPFISIAGTILAMILLPKLQAKPEYFYPLLALVIFRLGVIVKNISKKKKQKIEKKNTPKVSEQMTAIRETYKDDPRAMQSAMYDLMDEQDRKSLENFRKINVNFHKIVLSIQNH